MRILIFLLFLSSNIIAQSIVNTELKSINNNKFFAEIEGAFDIQKGNTEIYQVESSVLLGYNINNKNLIKVTFGHAQLSEQNESIDNDSYGQIRHNYKFSESIKSFAFLQYQKNLNLLLMERFIAGGGVRYDTKRKSFNFGIGSGIMYENEALLLPQGEENDIITVRMAGLSALVLPLNGTISLHNTTYFQPALFNFFFDFRLLNELTILIELNDRLSLENKFTFRHDSDPPSVLKEDDFGFVAGIVISL